MQFANQWIDTELETDSHHPLNPSSLAALKTIERPNVKANPLGSFFSAKLSTFKKGAVGTDLLGLQNEIRVSVSLSPVGKSS